MRLFGYFREHLGAVALVFVLLIAQAFCDLMLPNFTAQIVDVGIQQSGIEHASPDRLTAQTHDAVAAQLSGDDLALFEASYEKADETGETYVLAQRGGQSRAELDEAMAFPLASTYGLAQPGMDDALVQQAAIVAARTEYEQLGEDVLAMQMNYLLLTALKMMGFVLLSVIIASLVGLIASRTGAKIGRSLRSRLFAKVMSFSDAEVQTFSAASLITRGTNDVQQIQMMSIMVLRMVLYAPILAVGGIIMVARTDISMGWVIGLAILAIVVVVVTLMFIAMPKFRLMQKLVDRVNLVSREMLTGVSVVRAFGQQQREQARFDDASTQLMRTQLFTNRVMTFLMPTMMLVMNLVSAAIVWVGAQRVDAGAMQTGDLIAFITYSMIVIMGFLMLSMLAIIAPRADVSAHRIDEVLEAEVSIADPPADQAQHVLTKGAGTFVNMDAPTGASIEFDHVSFRYDDDSENVLDDVSFSVAPGTTCAIIGPTGSGKSTIAKLLERFYDVGAGSVRIDGVDVRNIPLHELRATIGYVPQMAFLFSGTIASNVGYGLDELDEARIAKALDIAQAREFVEAREEGADAEVTQGGTNVSGGQRQRLAIARALATDARVLVFDDSFSALDYKTDAALRAALASELPGKTQLVVAQRIATVMHADQIIVLDEGRIVGEGTHVELVESCPQYREIALTQLPPEEIGLADSALSGMSQGVSVAQEALSQNGEGGDKR